VSYDGAIRVYAINAVGRRSGRIIEIEDIDIGRPWLCPRIGAIGAAASKLRWQVGSSLARATRHYLLRLNVSGPAPTRPLPSKPRRSSESEFDSAGGLVMATRAVTTPASILRARERGDYSKAGGFGVSVGFAAQPSGAGHLKRSHFLATQPAFARQSCRPSVG
jgi:hypothetical protein